jgi:hypothetical protein
MLCAARPAPVVALPPQDPYTRSGRRSMAMSNWQGEGILHIAPVGMPWSIWLFWELMAAGDR